MKLQRDLMMEWFMFFSPPPQPSPWLYFAWLLILVQIG